MDGTRQMDIRLGGRAIKRLLITFLLACGLLTILYASRDRLSSYGYADLLVEEEFAKEDPYVDYVELELPEPEQAEPLKIINAKTCQDRRDFYKRLMAGKTSARTLNFDSQGKLLHQPFVLSETQSLFSDACYSAEECLTPLKHMADDSVNLCNAILQPANRTTVVLRLEIDNLFTEDAVFNMRRLIVEVGWSLGIDINILQIIGPEYNADKVPAEFQRLLTNYRRDDVFNEYPDETQAKTMIDRIGLNYQEAEGSRYATTFYQFPQIWFMKQRTYAFAYFLDSHLRNTGSWGDFFTQVQTVQQDADLLTFDPILPTRPSILWGPNEASLPESFFHTRMVIHGISAEMMRAMQQTLLRGVNAPHEGFMPAVAIKNDLKIVMFAHAIMKRKKKDDLMFETYSVPEGRDWTIANLNNQGEKQAWQFGGTFTADAGRWVDDLPRTKWIDLLYQSWRHEKKVCLPGLLMYPVSGR